MPPAITLRTTCPLGPSTTIGNVDEPQAGVSSTPPEAAMPMTLPWMSTPSFAAVTWTATPHAVIRLRAAGVEPPTCADGAAPTTTSAPESTSRCVPVGSVPRKLPSTRLFDPDEMSTLVVHPLTTSPRIVVSPVWTLKHVPTDPAAVNWIRRTVFRPWPNGCVLAEAPGCV